jgi:hypothetical protein
MATILIILLFAFFLFSIGLSIDYFFEHLDFSTLIMASFVGAFFITGCAHLWMKYQYEADQAFAQEWLANPDGNSEVIENKVILVIAKTVKDITGQKHTYRVSRSISTNNAQLLGIVSGEGKPLNNYHGYLFLTAGIIAGFLLSKMIRNFIDERRMAKHYRRLSPSTST